MNLEVIITTYVDGQADETGTVSTLKKPIVFTVALPDDIKKVPEGYDRELYVLYVHEGQEPKQIPVSKNADDTVSFEAHEFSTYALMYKDTKKQIRPQVMIPTAAQVIMQKTIPLHLHLRSRCV